MHRHLNRLVYMQMHMHVYRRVHRYDVLRLLRRRWRVATEAVHFDYRRAYTRATDMPSAMAGIPAQRTCRRRWPVCEERRDGRCHGSRCIMKPDYDLDRQTCRKRYRAIQAINSIYGLYSSGHNYHATTSHK